VTSGSETKSTSCSVTVQAPQPLPTVDLKVNNSDGPISVTLPTTITLTWTSQNASSCTASGSWSGSKSTSGSQSISLSSAGTYTYTLTCTNSSGSSSDSVTVNAQSQPSTTTQTQTSTTTITSIFRIINTNHDAESVGKTIYTMPSTAPWGQMYLGYDTYTAGRRYDGGWIFVTNIPKGAKIVSSTITLTANTDNYGPTKLAGYWYGYATSNPPDFVNGYSGKRISDLYPKTYNYVYHSFECNASRTKNCFS
jgi:hypothetical protein